MRNLAELHELREAIKAGRSVSQQELAAAAAAAQRAQQDALAYDFYRALKSPKPYQLYLQALSALNVGAVQLAEELEPLIGRPTDDMPDNEAIDILCLPGRIAKEKWLRTDGPDARDLALASAQAYAVATERYENYYPAINAATMYFAAAEVAEGRRIAEWVSMRWDARLAQDDPWLMASLGEAALLLGEFEAAARRYREAAEAAADSARMVGSMRRQLRVLRRILGDIPPAVREALDAGLVVVFTGHMIDHPQRPEPRFPPYLEAAVKSAIKDRLAALGARHGFCSAACGADLLFLEALNESGAEAKVILPFPRDDFVQTSVAFAGAHWKRRFDERLKVNPWEEVTKEPFLGENALFEHGNEVLLGEALNFALQIGADVALLAALDLDAETKRGGTRATVERCRERGIHTELIDIAELRRSTPAVATAPTAAPAIPAAAPWTRILKEQSNREVRTMLFADVVGFSKIPEHQSPAFFLHFLGQIQATIEASPRKPLLANTWGDGLYVVYDDVLAAADFALRLRDAVRDRDWTTVGLPKETSVRIGMHSGPVFLAHDPVIGRRNAFGSHVNRAARIEPVTAPGAVFLSAAAAALIAASGSADFACDYLGTIALAKNYDRVPLYRLRRATEIE